MVTKGIWVSLLSAAVAVLFLALTGPGAATPISTSPHSDVPNGLGVFAGNGSFGPAMAAGGSPIRTLCSLPVQAPSGVYPISKSSAYVENYSSGNLSACGSGHATRIAGPPSGYVSSTYVGLAGITVHGTLDLLLLSWELHGGYYCLGASASGCTSTQGFTLPSSFCASEPKGYCNPDGVVLSKSLGFTYVDVENVQMVTCTAYAASCSVDAASSAFSGHLPVLIAQHGSTLGVSDNSCTGEVWEGTTSSLTVVATIGDGLTGITFHGKTLYVADTGACTDSSAHLIDVKTGAALASPFSAPADIVGLDSDLQFDSLLGGGVYLQ